jgi:hypothetical protein
MLTYALLFAAGIIAARVLWRPLAALLRGMGMVLLALLGGRLALLADDQLTAVDWHAVSTGIVLGAVVAVVLVGYLLFQLIFNRMVNDKRREAHAGVDRAHDALLR